MEQSAYDGIKTRWGSISGTVQRHCDEVARFGGSGSYSILDSCIAMETEAGENMEGRAFQY